jgi:hypothetical protein
MTNSYELNEVRRANITDHQIGGITDGMTEEVAADLGFETHEDYLKIRARVGSLASAVERPQDIRIPSTVIVEGRPKATMTAQERAFAMAEKAKQRASDTKALEEMHAEMETSEVPSDNSEDTSTNSVNKPARRPKIAEQNANEKAHQKKARQDRWGK